MQAFLTGFALGVVYCAAAYRIYLRELRRRRQKQKRRLSCGNPRAGRHG